MDADLEKAIKLSLEEYKKQEEENKNQPPKPGMVLKTVIENGWVTQRWR